MKSLTLSSLLLLLMLNYSPLGVCPTENRSSGNLREKFFGARDEHTNSSLLSRAKVSAAAVPAGLAGGGASGLFHCGNRGHAGGGRFLRTVRRRRAAEQSVRSEDAVEGAGVRVRKRGVQLAQDRQEVGRGCGVSGSGRGEFSRSSHGEPGSAGAFGGVRGDLRASGEVGAGDEADRNGDAGDRRDQGAGKREQAQGDELWRMKEEERKLKGEIAELLRRAQAVDEAEDEQYGVERRGDELPEELRRREDRLKKIQEAKQRLEDRQKEEDRAAGRSENDGGWASGVRPQGGRSRHHREFGEVPEKKTENFTDPQSRIMKTQDGFQQCYNGQIAVESESGLIVANDVVQNAADNGCLVEMTEAAQAQGGEKPERVLADAGYRSEENFRKLAEKKITAYVALGREGKRGKDILPSTTNPHTQAMQERLRSEEGRYWYRQRKWLAEPPFGWIKHVLGFRRFSLRGHKKVQAEWQLVCAALNLKRIAVLTTS